MAAGAGLATALYTTRAGLTWLKYGHPPGPDIDEADRLLDEFIPAYEVVERHHVRVAAPAAIALAAACDMDLAQSPIIRAIFKTRERILGAKPDKVRSPRTLLAWAKELGWAVLAEIPDREVVLGAVTRPWDANPVFRPLPPQEFAGFHEPGFAKIVWTLRADPINATESIARTETRVATTDSAARKAFRRYWSLVSPGVEVIRWLSLQLVRREAEGRVRRSQTAVYSPALKDEPMHRQPPMSERQPDERDPIQKILKAGALYFALVFAAGFVLGIIRTLWIVPHLGTRKAELMEAPIMFAITVLAARWVVRRLAIRASFPARLAVGLIALGLLLLTEFTAVLWIRGLTIAEYLAGRDPVAGTVYVVLLAAFALMPSLGIGKSDLI